MTEGDTERAEAELQELKDKLEDAKYEINELKSLLSTVSDLGHDIYTKASI